MELRMPTLGKLWQGQPLGFHICSTSSREEPLSAWLSQNWPSSKSVFPESLTLQMRNKFRGMKQSIREYSHQSPKVSRALFFTCISLPSIIILGQMQFSVWANLILSSNVPDSLESCPFFQVPDWGTHPVYNWCAMSSESKHDMTHHEHTQVAWQKSHTPAVP
jgi:hypothetical protein